jgi:SAM-dependent methyltransferase
MSSDAKQFWSTQTSSLHRFSSDDFYRRKAEEHAATMSASDRTAECIDLGCGAGELLRHLAPLVRVTTGMDYSASMLAAARRRLDGLEIDLIEADPLERLAETTHRVWITTGAINQYYTPDRLHQLLDLLRDHSSARALYLFDCVDPLRYRTCPFGSSYLPPPDTEPLSLLSRLRRVAARWRVALALGMGRFEVPALRLGRTRMGFGQRPDFWIAAAAARGLGIEIVSSRFYEYRYHVRLRREDGT